MNNKLHITTILLSIAIFTANCGKKDDSSAEIKHDENPATSGHQTRSSVDKGTRLYAVVDKLRIRETPDLKGKVILDVVSHPPDPILIPEGGFVTFSGEVSKNSATLTLRGKKITAPFYKVRYDIGGEIDGVSYDGWIFAGALTDRVPDEEVSQDEFEADKENFHNLQYALQKGNSIAKYLAPEIEIVYHASDRCSGTLTGKIIIKQAQLAGQIDIPVKQTKDGWMENCAKDITKVSFDFYKLAGEAVRQGGRFSPMGESAGYELEGHNSVSFTIYGYNYRVVKIEYKIEDPG